MANVLGLNISSGLKTRVAVYILIPFLVIPQIMLSGVLVKYEDLNPVVGSDTKVPAIGNMMVARWAFEGLATDQFRNNVYERPLFRLEKQQSDAGYYRDWWAPRLETELDSITTGKAIQGTDIKKRMIAAELSALKAAYPALAIDVAATATEQHRRNLDSAKKFFNRQYNNSHELKEKLVARHVAQAGGAEQYTQLKNTYCNGKLEDMVKNTTSRKQMVVQGERIYRKYEPIFMQATTAGQPMPYYSSAKVLLGRQMDTIWYNLIVIWGMTAVLYVTLYFDLIRKMLAYKRSRKQA
jgi:hypothetical protein